MPAYVWNCQVCAASNEAGVTVCAQCAAPAELNSIESGDMCAMFLVLVLLPWTMAPAMIPYQIRGALPVVEYLMVFLGFSFSVALLHFIGRRIDAGIRKAS